MLVEHEHGATVVAHTTVRALRITRAGLHAQMLDDPDLAGHFVDRITERLNRVADELLRRGATVLATDREQADGLDRCDMSDAAAIDDYAGSIVAAHGRLDILVNNAGIQRRKPFVDFTEADFDDVFGVNVKGLFFASQAAARRMMEIGSGGSIINISSVNATHAQPETVLYCASKGAVATMTRALAVAFGEHGIRVNAVSPGPVETPILKQFRAVLGDARVDSDITRVGRAGTSADIAPAILFLCSDGARWINGANLPVDGGLEASINADVLGF